MLICEIWLLFDWYFPQYCTSDISKCYRGFLRLRDNESRLYVNIIKQSVVNERTYLSHLLCNTEMSKYLIIQKPTCVKLKKSSVNPFKPIVP